MPKGGRILEKTMVDQGLRNRSREWPVERPRGTTLGLQSLAAALALVGLANSASAQLTASPDELKERLGEEIRRVIDGTPTPSISVAVIQNGEIAWAEAYGFANLATKTPATDSTYYSTGSTFKFVTATAVMQLVEQGLLDLDRPINEILQSELTIRGADDVTLRHVLSHHAGLEAPIERTPLWSRLAPRTLTKLIEGVTRAGPPGSAFEYCNGCYGFLALAIKEASGETYDQYVARHILRPLGINSELASIPSADVVERLAMPYSVDGDEAKAVPYVRFDAYAAGDVYLRPVDMASFLAAHLNGGSFGDATILTEASVREMQRQQFDTGPYGLGTQVVEAQGRGLLYHSGSIPGFSSFYILDPSEGSGVYLMSNSGDATSILASLAQFAIRLLREGISH